MTAEDSISRDVAGAQNDVEHTGSDANPLPDAKTNVADRTPSAQLPPLNRTYGYHPNAAVGTKSFSTSRMAFMRRPKRLDSGTPKAGRVSSRDNEEQYSDDVLLTSAEDLGASESTRSASVPIPETPSLANPEGSLKKRVVRLEKTIAEQTAWLRNKFDLEESDTLLDSCSGALVRKILLQGRLHITSTSICFYAKIFGSVTKEKWPFCTIHSVRKRRGGFVANSIKITFIDPEAAPVIIASLNRRDQTLAIIASRLSVLSPSALDATDRTVSIDGDSEDHSDGAGPHEAGLMEDRNRSDRSNCSTPHMSISDVPSRNSRDGRRSSDSTSDDIPHLLAPRGIGKSSIPVCPESYVWFCRGDPIDRVHGNEFRRRTEQARCVFEVPVVIVFNALFMGDWFASYLEQCNHFDVEASDWYVDSADGFIRRDLKYRRPLAYRIGPKETRVKDAQRYSYTKDGGVLVESESISLEAPFGEYFRVETYYELRPLNFGRGAELIASIAVHFIKSTMLRSKIESGALAETKITLGTLIDLGKVRVAEVATTPQVAEFLRSRRRLGQSQGPTKQRLKTNSLGAASQLHSQSRSGYDVQPQRTESDTHAYRSSVGSIAKEDVSSATIIHMQDVMSAQLLRIIAVVSLLAVCVLLLLVLLSFRRMKHEFKVLQAIVRELQKSPPPRQVTSCGTS